ASARGLTWAPGVVMISPAASQQDVGGTVSGLHDRLHHLPWQRWRRGLVVVPGGRRGPAGRACRCVHGRPSPPVPRWRDWHQRPGGRPQRALFTLVGGWGRRLGERQQGEGYRCRERPEMMVFLIAVSP